MPQEGALQSTAQAEQGADPGSLIPPAGTDLHLGRKEGQA